MHGQSVDTALLTPGSHIYKQGSTPREPNYGPSPPCPTGQVWHPISANGPLHNQAWAAPWLIAPIIRQAWPNSLLELPDRQTPRSLTSLLQGTTWMQAICAKMRKTSALRSATADMEATSNCTVQQPVSFKWREDLTVPLSDLALGWPFSRMFFLSPSLAGLPSVLSLESKCVTCCTYVHVAQA